MDNDKRGGQFAIGEREARWSVMGASVSVEDSTYHPEFGLSVAGRVIQIVFEDSEVVFDLVWDEIGQVQ